VLLESVGEGLVVGDELKLWHKHLNFVDASVKAEKGKRCEAAVRLHSKFRHWLAQDDSVPGPNRLIHAVVEYEDE
jgi:hypothetical protein